MAAESRLKSIGTTFLGIFVMVAMLGLVVLFIRGVAWASEVGLPWLLKAAGITFDFCGFVLLPLSFFRKTRLWAGMGFYVSSFVFGISLFAYSCIVVLQIWGYFGLIFGLLFGGIGVVPVAFLATLFHGAWPLFWNVFIGTVLTFGTRILGLRLGDSRPRQQPQEEVVDLSR